MTRKEWDAMFTEVGILAEAGVSVEDGMRNSMPFKVGDRFDTLAGLTVECVELKEFPGYDCAKFTDGAWRYNRPYDRGRVTGCGWDHPKNIVPKFKV